MYNTPLMSVKVRWAFASILCLCTLVALWVTGARVRTQKMAARYGERMASAPIDAAGTSAVTLPRDQRVSVEHFILEFARGEAVRVLDHAGAALAEFPGPKKGDLRRWQELQLTFVAVGPESVVVEVEFKPGSPCFGSGRYRALRQGLQIQFIGGRSVTIAAWDGAKPQATLRFEGPAGNVDSVVNSGSRTGEAFKIRYQFDPDGSLVLQSLN